MNTYRVSLQLDESGQWIAAVAGVRGCHTYGRTLPEARSRIREALSLFVPDAATAKLVDSVRVPREGGARAARRRG
jgi:predicted RNase H-like HicB family nuclease